MTETSNCIDDDGGDDDDDRDDDTSVLQTELGPQPLTIMKAR